MKKGLKSKKTINFQKWIIPIILVSLIIFSILYAQSPYFNSKITGHAFEKISDDEDPIFKSLEKKEKDRKEKKEKKKRKKKSKDDDKDDDEKDDDEKDDEKKSEEIEEIEEEILDNEVEEIDGEIEIEEEIEEEILDNEVEEILTDEIEIEEEIEETLTDEILEEDEIEETDWEDELEKTDKNEGTLEESENSVITGRIAKEESITAYKINEGKEFEKETYVSVTLKKIDSRSDKILFNKKDEEHEITILEIKETSVTIQVKSYPKTATMAVGETKTFDTDENGIEDTGIKVKSITGSSAWLTVVSLDEKYENPPEKSPEDYSNSIMETGIEANYEVSQEPPIGLKLKVPKRPYLVIGIVFIVLISSYILLKKKNKKQ
jgi:hypothetical protein